jgi:Ca2+/Na+ antiporter|tara:strand:+ start:100 stop:273 length:174 start_codon:yes stop_codon:yes gene_type:complete
MRKLIKLGIPWLIVIIFFIFVPRIHPTSIVGIVIFVALITYTFITVKQEEDLKNKGN